METNKKQDYGNQVITHNKNKGTRRFSWNFLLILYVIGISVMAGILFVPFSGETNIWGCLVSGSIDYEAMLDTERLLLFVKIFLGCMIFKAISLSIWLGKNI